MTTTDDLEVQAAVQEKRFAQANAAVPSARGWRAGLVSVAVAVLLLLAFVGARAVYTEARYAAQQQMIAELAAQVEDLGGVPVVTTDPVTGQPGAVGASGPAGQDGQDGADGQDSTVPGPPGSNGQDGTNGTNGTNGADGQTGQSGGTGAQGEPGPAGPQGPPGQAGAQGPQGATGVGITSITCNETTGQWLVTFTDGTTTNPGGYCIPQPGPQPSPEPSGEEPINS